MRRILTLLFLAINTLLSATSYYVKNGGSDSNSGLDDAHAWAHHPWMSTWTGSVVLSAGDIVHLKRGSNWSIANPTDSFIIVKQSGIAGNPIITTWYGTSGDKPLIQITGDYPYSVIQSFGKSFITFDHLDIKHFSSIQDLYNFQNGIMFSKDAINNVPHDWIITNCEIHNIPKYGICGYDDSYNIIIGDITATSCATALSYSNHIYDCGYCGIMLAGRNPENNISNWQVYYNYVHDIDNNGGLRNAYGISFSSDKVGGAGIGYSTGWPSYATARFNRVANVSGHEGIECHGGTYIYFQDNFVYNCLDGILLQAADRSYAEIATMDHGFIERNTVENSGNHAFSNYSFIGVVAENSLFRATNCYVRDNKCFYTERPSSEKSAFGINLYNVDGVTVERNRVFNGPVGDAGAGIGISSSGTSKNVILSNNWIDNWDHGIYFPSDNLDGDVLINNNIVHSHQKPFVIYEGTLISGVNIMIYNNSMFSSSTAPYPYVIQTNLGDLIINSGASLFIKNNILGIISTTGAGRYILGPTVINGSFECDYNLFWNSTFSTPFVLNDAYHNWADWNAHGYDTHSLNNTDPLFTNESGLYSEDSDFKLKNNSPSINRGVVVSEIVSDFYGEPRDDVPDIGADEYYIPDQTIVATAIKVTGEGGATTITTDKGTLQLSAAITPDNASNKTVTWSIANGTGQATINSTGLVTAAANGTITAKATSNDSQGISGTLVITISNQIIPVTGITVTGAGGATTITTDKGTLQLSAAITPDNASNKTVTWSIANGTGQATINSTGLVTAAASGTITAKATTNDGSGVYGILVITISNKIIPTTKIIVTGAGGINTISTYHGTLQLSVAITPSNATNQTVKWSISEGTGQASISTFGVVTAIANGMVTVRATSSDGSGVFGIMVITISNQVIPIYPTYLNSTIQNITPSILEMNYDVMLANAVPSASAFKVTVNSISRAVNSVTISGTRVLLTLSAKVFYKDIIEVSYIVPSTNPLQSTIGYQAASLIRQPVTNNVSTVNSPPVIVVNYQSNSYSGIISEIDASESYDPDDDNLTYAWEIPSDIPVSSTSSSKIRFLNPSIKTYYQNVEFMLKVSDGNTIQSRIIPIEILPYRPELIEVEISDVEASSYESPFYPYNIIDGNIGTMWVANGINQWVTVKLKEFSDVQHVKLAFQPGQKKESYFDILGSSDSLYWESILNKSASCDFSGDLQVFEFPQSKSWKEYGYIKLIGLGNSKDSWNYISELKIFGYKNRNAKNYEEQPIKIYPNPAKKFINIRIDSSTLLPDFIRILNLLGKVVFQDKITPDIKELQIPINLIEGVYIVQIGSGNLTLFTQKLIVEKNGL